MKKYKISLLVVAVFMFSLFSSTAFAVPDDSILSQHIQEADGTSGQDTNSGSGIKTGHIQDGAVTPAKIGFYSNVIIVAPSGGDFTSINVALNSISPSSTSPYVVKVMPGIYEEGQSIYMKSYVALIGEDRETVIIRAPQNSYPLIYCINVTTATIAGFTLDGGLHGIRNDNSTLTIMKNIFINIDNYGILNRDASSPLIVGNFFKNGRGFGITNFSSSATIKDNAIDGTYGLIGGIAEYSSSSIISNNTITNMPYKWGVIIGVDPNALTPSTSKVTHNVILNTQGIWVSNSTPNISFNIVDGVTGTGAVGNYNASPNGAAVVLP